MRKAVMNKMRLVLWLSAAAAALPCLTVVPAAVHGQSRTPAAEIPRLSDGKPDFSGFWDYPRPANSNVIPTTFDKAKMAPFVAGGEALFYEPRTGDPRHDEPRAFCMPSGFPSAFLGPYPIQIVQAPKYMVMVTEFMRVTRLIPLDGRPHMKDIEPTFYGDPVGHWEGDTLVIDSTNYKRWSLDDHYYENPKEYRMHTDAFHTIERLRRTDAHTISYEFTVDDPKIFTRPWSADWQMTLHPEWEKTGLYEMVCNENNRCEGGNCRASK
jgi:hypothetical protein